MTVKQTMELRRLGEKLRTAAKQELAPSGRARRALGDLGALTMAFLLGRTVRPGGCAPLGPGFLAACGEKRRGALAAVGLMLGSVSGLGLVYGLRYAAVGLLIYATLFLLKGFGFARRRWFGPLAASLMTALVGGVYLRFGEETGVTFLPWLCEAILAGGSCMLFRSGFRHVREEERSRIGMAFLAMASCMALGSIQIAGVISVGRC